MRILSIRSVIKYKFFSLTKSYPYPLTQSFHTETKSHSDPPSLFSQWRLWNGGGYCQHHGDSPSRAEPDPHPAPWYPIPCPATGQLCPWRGEQDVLPLFFMLYLFARSMNWEKNGFNFPGILLLWMFLVGWLQWNKLLFTYLCVRHKCKQCELCRAVTEKASIFFPTWVIA